jgi:Mn2+/Fe2+ NRAMP family transporter
MQFLKRRAENWVSTLVLVGCILITLVLIYTAFEANALGERFNENAGIIESNY